MELGGVEKKVIGAMLILSDKDNVVKASYTQLARAMGYAKPGGAITFAVKSLEMQNYIAVLGKNEYKVLI